jgi:hypothetical protein
MEITDKALGIYADKGCLRVVTGPYKWQAITELPLNKLEEVYKRWQTLAPFLDKPLADLLVNHKRIRDKILKLLRDFGFTRPSEFSVSQIQALLFYWESDQGVGESILWRFHTFFPVTAIPDDPDEPSPDLSNLMPNLNPFETARLYLVETGIKMDLDRAPLSDVMKICVSKALLSWASSPENKAKLKEAEQRKWVDANPLDMGMVEDMLKLTKIE